MISINMKRSLAAGALAMLATVVLVSAQDTPSLMTPQQQQQAQSGLARLKAMFQFDPIVDTGMSDLGGRRVYVHVPGLFDMKLDTRANNQGVRISQSVLAGLVSIYMDRTRAADSGRLSGPISVKVGGMTMYQNEEARNMGGVPVIPAPMIPSASV